MNNLQDWTKPHSSPGKRWFAVFTLPNKEAQARLGLARQGFEVFIPQRFRTVRHARRTTTVLRPLFPRYLFVRLDPKSARWRSINGTRGVASIVSFGDQPTPVPINLVEAIASNCDAHGVVQMAEDFRLGQSVCFEAGPFANLVGVVDRLDGQDAVGVLLEIMGRRVVVRVPRDLVLSAA
jgi:transcription elongation factor/antiterminator RfaH